MVTPLISAIAAIASLALILWKRGQKGFHPVLSGHFARSSHALKRIDRLVLNTQSSVHLVRLGDRALLLGVSPEGIRVLDRLLSVEIEGAILRADDVTGIEPSGQRRPAL